MLHSQHLSADLASLEKTAMDGALLQGGDDHSYSLLRRLIVRADAKWPEENGQVGTPWPQAAGMPQNLIDISPS